MGLLQKSVVEIREFKESMGEDFDQAKFDEYVNSDDGKYSKKLHDTYVMKTEAKTFFEDMNQKCDI